MPRTCLVTGANRGIGLEFVRQLSSRGDRVIATARDPEGSAQLRSLGVRLERLDVGSTDSVGALKQAVGDEPIDVLVNNAGFNSDRSDRLAELDQKELLKAFRVNSLGPVFVTRALLRNLQAGRGRLVVQISSVMGSIDRNVRSGSAGGYAYRSSKAALNMLNTCLAHELRPLGIACVALHPGWVRTDMGGGNATLSPEESVRSMLDLFDRLTLDDTGRFLERDGSPIPW